jgi:hypothetical protein
MLSRSFAPAVAITLTAVATAGHLSAQASAPAKLMGKWVMDTTNGSDDHGLPKSETLVFSPQTGGFHLVATEDDGQGPGTSTFDCAPSGASTTLSPTQVALCTIHVTGDSVLYTVDVLNNGQTVATERGRLVVSPSGQMLRDQYDATAGSAKATHHRHMYVKQP